MRLFRKRNVALLIILLVLPIFGVFWARARVIGLRINQLIETWESQGHTASDIGHEHSLYFSLGLEKRLTETDRRTISDAAPFLWTFVGKDGAIDDNDLSLFSTCAYLETIDLRGTNITGPGLRHLKSCTSLQNLILGSRFADDGIPFLLELTQVKDLGLATTSVTTAGLKRLAGLNGVQVLSIDLCADIDIGALPDALNSFKSLRRIAILNAPLDVRQTLETMCPNMPLVFVTPD